MITLLGPTFPKAVVKATRQDIRETVGIRLTEQKCRDVDLWKAAHENATAEETEEHVKEIELRCADMINWEKAVELACALTYAWWADLQAPVYDNGSTISR